MKRLFFGILFVLLAGLFIWLFMNRQALSSTGSVRQQPRTVIPAVSADTERGADNDVSAASYDESKVQPLITLANDETFLQAITGDLNHDGIADQICAVKNVTDSAIYLVPGLQNPSSGEYGRGTPIKTGVTQSRTLLFYIMDVIGDHSDALVYSGMTGENMQLMAVYLPSITAQGKIEYRAVADLRSDGPITIKEVTRYEAYDLGLTAGESFPIVTYSSDPDSPQTLDQVERTYVWDKTLKRYAQLSETHITGKKIESTLLRQLQGGDIDSFKRFLNGLWYRSAGDEGDQTLYLFYEAATDEFVFNNGVTEEIYQIDSVVSRRYGVYLTTRNKSISSIRRLIDIELSAADEIRIKIQEDVKLKIGVASDWDGIYRKMSGTLAKPADPGENAISAIKDRINGTTTWKSSDDTELTFLQSEYQLAGPASSERGMWALLKVEDKAVMQFKPRGDKSVSRFYRITLGKNGLLLQPVTISMKGISVTGESTLEFMGTAP